MLRWSEALQQRLWRRLPRVPQLTLVQRRIYLLPTRFGAMLLLVALLVWIGALNYAVSLAYALAFWIVSLLLLSVLLAYRQLAGLQLSAGTDGAVFAGGDAGFRVTLRWPQGCPGRVRLAWLDGSGLCQRSGDGELLLTLAAPHRGLLSMPPLRVWSEAPLGLVRAFAYARLSAAQWVYPAPLADQDGSRQAWAAGEGAATRQPDGDDFNGLAPWQAGQSLQRIAWPVYARRQVLAARDFGAPQGAAPHWQLAWDDYPPQMGRESRLSRLCWQLLQALHHGCAVTLILPQQQLQLPAGEIDAGLLALARFGVGDAG